MNDERVILFDDANNDYDIEDVDLGDLSPELRAKLEKAMFGENRIDLVAA